MLGFAFFAGTMSLLAFWPRRYPGLWELLIVNKTALTVVEVLLIYNQATNAQSTAIADGILSTPSRKFRARCQAAVARVGALD